MTLPLFENLADRPAKPVALRSLSALDRMFNAMLGRHWVWPGMDGGPACKVVTDRVVSPADIPAEHGVCLSWAGVSFWVVGAPKVFQALCGFDPWVDQASREPDAVEPGWPLREVLSVLNNFLFQRPADWVQPVAEMGVWSARASHTVALECSIWSDEAVWLDKFWIVPVEIERVAAFVPGLMDRSGLQMRALAGLPELPVMLPLVIGEAQMALGQLQGVTVGDAVCFSRTLLSGNTGLRIEFSGGALGVRIMDAGRLEVVSPAVFSKNGGEASMNDDFEMGDLSLEPPGQGDVVLQSEPASALDLPVKVQALAGVVTLTVAKLGALKPGDTIDLEEPAQAMVKLVAGGREIGAGELVDVDGRLGVQISRWDLKS